MLKIVEYILFEKSGQHLIIEMLNLIGQSFKERFAFAIPEAYPSQNEPYLQGSPPMDHNLTWLS